MLSVSHGSNVINFCPQKRFDVVRVLATAPKSSLVIYYHKENLSGEELVKSWKKTAKKFGFAVEVTDNVSGKYITFKEMK